MIEFFSTPFIAFALFVVGLFGVPQNDIVVGVAPRVLVVSQGGTGASTFSTGECLVGNGTGAITTQACGGASGASAWEKYTGLASPLNIITPTTSGASIFVSGHATVTQALTLGNLSGSGEDLKIDSNGLLFRGTDATGAGSTSGALGDLSDVATTSAALYSLLALQSTGVYDSIATSTFNIAYSDLVGAPSLFSGSWDDLTSKPATSTVLSLLDSDSRIATLNATTTNVGALTVYTSAIFPSASIAWSSLVVPTSTTDQLPEGVSNLYYTDARVGDFIDASSTIQAYFSNAATAFGWGNHAIQNYLDKDTDTYVETESDPVWIADPIYTDHRFATLYASSTLMTSATTTHLAVTGLFAASCDVKSTTDGVFYCGTDATGAGATGAAWEKYTGLASPSSIITPTTTNASVFIDGHTTSTEGFTAGSGGADDSIINFYDTGILSLALGWDITADTFAFAPAVLGTSDILTLNTIGVTSTVPFHATEICISNDCKTVWPTGGSGGQAWEKYTGINSPIDIITPTTTNASIFVSGNATVTSQLIVGSGAQPTVNSPLTVVGTGGTSNYLGQFIDSTGVVFAIRRVGGVPSINIGTAGRSRQIGNDLEFAAVLETGKMRFQSDSAVRFIYQDISGSVTRDSMYLNTFTNKLAVGGYFTTPTSTLSVMDSFAVWDNTAHKDIFQISTTYASTTLPFWVNNNATTTGSFSAGEYCVDGADCTTSLQTKLNFLTASSTALGAGVSSAFKIYTVPVPANTLGTNGMVIAKIHIDKWRLLNTGGTDNFTFIVQYGNATSSKLISRVFDVDQAGYAEVWLMANGTTNSQKIWAQWNTGTMDEQAAANTTNITLAETVAIDSTQAENLYIWGRFSNTGANYLDIGGAYSIKMK